MAKDIKYGDKRSDRQLAGFASSYESIFSKFTKVVDEHDEADVLIEDGEINKQMELIKSTLSKLSKIQVQHQKLKESVEGFVEENTEAEEGAGRGASRKKKAKRKQTSVEKGLDDFETALIAKVEHLNNKHAILEKTLMNMATQHKHIRDAMSGGLKSAGIGLNVERYSPGVLRGYIYEAKDYMAAHPDKSIQEREEELPVLQKKLTRTQQKIKKGRKYRKGKRK